MRVNRSDGLARFKLLARLNLAVHLIRHLACWIAGRGGALAATTTTTTTALAAATTTTTTTAAAAAVLFGYCDFCSRAVKGGKGFSSADGDDGVALGGGDVGQFGG